MHRIFPISDILLKRKMPLANHPRTNTMAEEVTRKLKGIERYTNFNLERENVSDRFHFSLRYLKNRSKFN